MHNVGAGSFRLMIAALLVGTLTSSAYAYLDPGTGSIVLQVLLGGFAGLALAGKLYWNKFLSLIGLKKRERENTVTESVKSDARSRN